MRQMEENRLCSGINVEAVKTSVEELITHLSEQIKRTEALIHDHIDRHPSLKKQSELLDSIPGIGEATAAALLAEVPDLKQYGSARQVAAFAGLVPRERQSGSSVRGRVRLSKIGSSRLRKALYFPAITALRCSAFFQQWAEGLRQRGKSKDGSDRRGDAQARASGLWRAQDGQAIRPGVGAEGKNSLTQNTVSHPRPCATYMT
jgi:transposase